MTAVVKVQDFAIFSRSPERIASVIKANLGENAKLRMSNFDRISVPAGGGTSWTVPGLSGEESVKEITGIVLYWKPARAFWRSEYTGKTTSPDCRSDDGITGIGNPGGRCDICEFSQWESDPRGGKGQWCKAMKQLFILRPNTIMPTVLTMPPTSLTVIDRFFYRLMANILNHYEVVTSLKLERVDNGDVPVYSRVVMEHVTNLTDEQIVAVESLRNQLIPVFNAVRATEEEDTEK